MTLTDLLSQLDQLDRDDQLRVIDHLMNMLEFEATDKTSLAEADYEAKWDASFAKSQDLLIRMAAKARQNRDNGLSQEFDPDQL